MSSPSDEMTIGRLADLAGVNLETIRFYQRKGLLVEPEKPVHGIRRYSATDAARVKFIKSAQRLGFNLQEIGQLLALDDGTQCGKAAAIAQMRLDDVRARLNDLMRMDAALSRLLAACHTQHGTVSCPLIEALH